MSQQLAAHFETPDYIRAMYGDQQPNLAKYTAGIGQSRGPHISTKNATFNLIGLDKVAKPPMAPNGMMLIDPLKGVPFIDVIVLDAADAVAKVFYEKGFVEGENAPPDCWSDDGAYPDVSVLEPVSLQCAGCPNNLFGSAINEKTGAKGKACGDRKRLAVAFLWDIKGPVYEFSVSPSNLKGWQTYAFDISQRVFGGPESIVTRIYIDRSRQGGLLFEPAPRPMSNGQGGNTYPQGTGYWLISEQMAPLIIEKRRSPETKRAIGADLKSLPLLGAPAQQQQLEYSGATIDQAPSQVAQEKPKGTRRTKAQMEAERQLLQEAAGKATGAAVPPPPPPPPPPAAAQQQQLADPMGGDAFTPAAMPDPMGGAPTDQHPAHQGAQTNFGVTTGAPAASPEMEEMLGMLA